MCYMSKKEKSSKPELLINIPDRYYNGDKLLSQKDKNNKIPGIYIANSNRSAGKTTFFGIKLLQDFINKGEQFIILTRTKNEIEEPETLFEEVLDAYFPESLMHSKTYVKRLITAIYFENKMCGFAVCLKDAVTLKKYSSVFTKVGSGFMDELQPENGYYLRNEVTLLKSVIKTVSRGGGAQARYVRWIFLSNNINIMNPYFLQLKIYKDIPENISELAKKEDIYIKGNGYVCEFAYNESAAKEAAVNPAMLAFMEDEQVDISTTAEFMVKSNSFIIKKMGGKMDYLFTLKFNGQFFAVRRVKKNGYIYVTSSYDPSYKGVIAINGSDHDEMTIQLQNNTFYMATLRDSYCAGIMRFSDLEAKNTIIELLGVDLYR